MKLTPYQIFVPIVALIPSTPGVVTALVGMKTRAHVEENLALATRPLLSPNQLSQLFDRTSGARHRC